MPAAKPAPSFLKHLRAAFVLPFTVTIVIPTLLLWLTRGGSGETILHLARGGFRLAFLACAIALFALGLVLMISTNLLFSRIGRGTLAPWDPTSELVVRGPYRHVRNPMITGVMCLLLGEAALFGSFALLAWFGVFAAINTIFIPLLEEPDLVRRFGPSYEAYRANVPRWIPRVRPWRSLNEAELKGVERDG